MVLLSGAPATAATNLLINGGFETGNFAGWSLSGNSTKYVGVGGGITTEGRYAAFFGPTGADAILSQGLSTNVGQDYDISFSLKNTWAGGNSFQVFFGDAPAAISFTDETSFDWFTFSFTAQASASETWLSFAFRNDPALFYLDNISVTAKPTGLGEGPVSAVPEPASWTMMIAGFGMLGFALRKQRRRQSHYA